MAGVILGDCRDVLATFDADSLDACVTDPPYDLTSTSRGGSPRKNDPSTPYGRTRLGEASGGFMGKTWDGTGVAFQPETWVAVLRVLKPGAHLLAFGGTRTHHRLMCAIEDAGFEIRDTCMWLYGTGFPKSLDVGKAIDKAAGAEREVVDTGHSGKNRSVLNAALYPDSFGGDYDLTSPATDAARQWDGWGTALKPAWEPIIIARKPLIGTVAANVMEHGTGALNIDGCRVDGVGWSKQDRASGAGFMSDKFMGVAGRGEPTQQDGYRESQKGRWPANVVLDEEAAAMLDEQSGRLGDARRPHRDRETPVSSGHIYGKALGNRLGATYPDTGGASRFFYTAKASRREREDGLRGSVPCNEPTCRGVKTETHVNERGQTVKCHRNGHPTVKPVALMRWLVRLVTYPGGTVVDPFMGSGSTKLACDVERFGFVGIDQDEHYCEIAEARKLLPEVEAEAAQMGLSL